LDVLDALLQRIGPHVAIVRKCFKHRALTRAPDHFERIALRWFVALTVVIALLAVALAPLLH
jgi:hypothetical protein